jgi:HlyD family secretion protein
MRIITFLIAAGLPALLIGCGAAGPDRPSAARDTPLVVTTATATLGDRAETFEAAGVLRGRTSATVASRMMASVRAVLVRPGDHVRAGQPLVELDDRDVTATARHAAATHVAAGLAVSAARAERDAAIAALTLAQSAHRRVAALEARQSATAEELDRGVAALRGAEARVASTSAAMGEAEARVDGARAAAEAARVAAAFARVVAPFDGLVTEQLVDPGNLVSPGTPLIRIEDTASFELDVRLDESRTAWIARDAPIEVIVDGADRLGLTGRVFDVARAIESDSRTFLVTIALPSTTALRPGMYGRAMIPGPPRRVLTVPEPAIVRQGQLASVFVTEEGRVRMRLVSIGRTASGSTEILAGLAEGESVVVAPAPALQDGARVAERPAAASGGRS